MFSRHMIGLAWKKMNDCVFSIPVAQPERKTAAIGIATTL
jgi:hypothetical protein